MKLLQRATTQVSSRNQFPSRNPNCSLVTEAKPQTQDCLMKLHASLHNTPRPPTPVYLNITRFCRGAVLAVLWRAAVRAPVARSSPCCRASYTATWCTGTGVGARCGALAHAIRRAPIRRRSWHLSASMETFPEYSTKRTSHSYTDFSRNNDRLSVSRSGRSPWELVCGHRGDNGGPGRPCGDLCGGVRFLGRFTHLSGRFADTKKFGGCISGGSCTACLTREFSFRQMPE